MKGFLALLCNKVVCFIAINHVISKNAFDLLKIREGGGLDDQFSVQMPFDSIRIQASI